MGLSNNPWGKMTTFDNVSILLCITYGIDLSMKWSDLSNTQH
jgi:hypothetical protein